MGLPELYAFLDDEHVLKLLDEALALPHEPLEQYAQPTLRQALALVIDPPGYPIDFKPIESELGPWIEAYNAVLTSQRQHAQYLIRRITRDLARPGGIPALARLTHPDVAGVVRVAAFESFVKAKKKISAPIDALVRGASDSSARVRTFVHELLPLADALPALRAAHASAKGKQRALLEEAITALGGENTVERPATTSDAKLLEQLVALWRDTRQPEVADLIDVAAAQLPRESIAGRSAAERELQWQAVAKTRSAAALGALLATPWPTKWRDGSERLDALSTWSDPRIATALEKMLEAPPYTSQASRLFYSRLLRVLSSVGDVRQQAPLAELRPALEKTLGGYLQDTDIRALVDGTRLAEALELAPARSYTTGQAALLDHARVQLGSTATTTRATRHTEAELLAEIYASPESDAARLVYADFLDERGDPRGELIVLQCSAQRTEESIRRERALINRHEEQLVGPLAPYIQKGGRDFERGFLSACRCESRGFKNGAKEPAWATIRSLSFVHNYGLDLAEFLAGQQSGSLRALHGLRSQTAAEIASERIEEISYATREPHAELPNLPNLRRLGILISYYDRGLEQPLLAGPLWPRLERFTVNDGSQRILYWRDQLARATNMKELVLADSRQRAFLEDPEGWTITLQPGARVRILVELHSKTYSSPLEHLATLPKNAFEIVVVPSRSLSADPEMKATLAALAT